MKGGYRNCKPFTSKVTNVLDFGGPIKNGHQKVTDFGMPFCKISEWRMISGMSVAELYLCLYKTSPNFLSQGALCYAHSLEERREAHWEGV